MELSHWCLAPNYAWYVETEFVDAFLQVDEDHVRQYLEAVPPTVNNDLAAVPDLTGVAHSWLRQLHLVDLWLVPSLFFCSKLENGQ